MRVTELTITNLRAIKRAHFKFLPGFNLVVGVNGVGKTSVLHALAFNLYAVLKHVHRLGTKARSFSLNDIRLNTDALTVECHLEIDNTGYQYLTHKPREKTIVLDAGTKTEKRVANPTKSTFMGSVPAALAGDKSVDGQPLALLFTTLRALPSERAQSNEAAAGGIVAACADALSARELRLSELAEWVRVQAELPQSAKILATLEQTVARFLPGYTNLWVTQSKKPTLVLDRDNTTIEVSHLSDGERGVLALVLDISKRLSQANPHLERPTEQAEAVVLIDEIDLHLHPKWQRHIIHNLTAAFPKCQFIATTHSPQVIGEIEHNRIQVLDGDMVYSPTHAFGVDSNRVLAEIMDTRPRTAEIHNLLSQLSQVIADENLAEARDLLDKLIRRLGENDPEVTRVVSLLEFLED